MVKINLSAFKKKKVWIPLLVLVVIAAGAGGLWIYHENPNFCGTCHTMKSYVDSYQNPPLLAYGHKLAGNNCLDCHPFTISQSWKDFMATVKNDFSTPLEPIEFTQDQCFECHGNYTELKQLTVDMTSIVGRNPHDGHHGDLECNTCHSMHKTSVDFCSQCHNPVTTDDGWTTWANK